MTPINEAERWQRVLEQGLADSTIRTGSRFWTVFRLGPLKLAYPNFPMGLDESDAPLLAELAPISLELRAAGVDLVRLSAPASMFAGRPPPRVIDLPETAIADLQAWDVGRLSPGVRRKLRKATSAGLRMAAISPSEGELVHRLYRRAVSRNQGSVRYPQRYFEALCAAAQSDPAVQLGKVLCADRVAAFIAVIHRAGISYYLHGGFEEEFAALRPGYFAMAWAIQSARDRGSRRFEFLTSPLSQPALREYKESFGGVSRWRAHWDVPLTWLGRCAGALLYWRQARKPAQARAVKQTSA